MSAQIDDTAGAPDAPQLRKALSDRHVTMISFGGIIGAGLFVGSGASIATAGPAILVSYLLAGVMILFIMRMLGEMAAATPNLGSFTEYARLGLGDWAGFVSGWLYWYFWVVVVGIEAIAGAKILQVWYPDLPIWLSGTVLLALMTGINLMSTRSYGEFEFWFASIKVAAIIAFILAGFAFVFGVTSGVGPTFSNLTAHGGFAPLGITPIFAGVTSVIFSLTGAEIATIAAAESKDPLRAMTRATQSVAVRIMLFFVLSIFVIVCVLPWNEIAVGQSPFAQALDRMGVPAAAFVMNLVVLTAVLSCLNSGLYVTSRVLFTLAAKGEAPKALVKLNARQVPAPAILLGGFIGLLTVLTAIISPDGIFPFLVNACGCTILMIYLLIALAQIRLRNQFERSDPSRLLIRMWLFPYLSWFVVVAVAVVLMAMALTPALASQFWLSLLSVAVTFAAYFAVLRSRRSRTAEV